MLPTRPFFSGGRRHTLGEAGRLMALLTAHKAIVETGDLERRIQALDAKKWGAARTAATSPNCGRKAELLFDVVWPLVRQ
jgi:hypothetical protein